MILRVLVCSRQDLRPDLAETVIGAHGIEMYRVQTLADAKLVGSSLGVQVILVDSALPDAADFIRQLRLSPATRKRSVAVLARSPEASDGADLMAAGANAVLPLPPGADWNERFSRLLKVPVRQQTPLPIHYQRPPDPERSAEILNLSPGGMLLATDQSLKVGDRIGFRFGLSGGHMVVGRGRVAREARPTGFGIEFLELQGDGKTVVADYLRSLRIG